MDNNILKTCIIVLIGLIFYVLTVKNIIKSGKQLKENYDIYLKRYSLKVNSEKIENTLRDESFFYMTNDGPDPCDLKKDIGYIDYIGQSSLYMEMK